MKSYFDNFPTVSFNKVKIKDIMKRIRVKDEVRDNIGIYEKYIVRDGETPHVLAERFYGSPELHWIILLLNNIEDGRADWVLADRVFEEYITLKYPYQAIMLENSNDAVLFYAGDSITNGNVTSEIISVDLSMRKLIVVANVADYVGGDNVVSLANASLFANVESSVLESESPHHYQITLFSNETIVVNRDASYSYLGTVYNPSEVTVREYENTINENKREIIILKKEYVGDFIREFEEKMKL